MTERRKVRWVIAHYPVYLFERTAKKFSDELEKLCPGQFDIEIHTPESYVKQYNKLNELLLLPPDISSLEAAPNASNDRKVNNYKDVRAKWDVLFNAIASGDIEMSQTQVSIIGMHLYDKFNSLDLPFMFDSHDHVTRVLDGTIGETLCEDLSKNTEVRGLGFTYSGGYRIIGTKNKITNLSELATTTLLTGTRPSNFFFNTLGVLTGGINVVPKRKLIDGNIVGDAVETTYLRYAGKNVLKTDHSMFMTTILTGNKFWDTLTFEQQQAFKVVAKIVSQAERAWSIEDAKKYEQDAVSNGITISSLDEEDKQVLRQAAKDSIRYLKWQDFYDENLVNSIIQLGDAKK